MIFPLAAESVSGHLEFFANLRFQSVGVLIVLTSLGGLAIIVTLVGRVIEKRYAGTRAAAPATAAAPSAAAEGIAPEIRAAIAAAVAVVARTPVTILEVTQTPDARLASWSVEGRRQIFHSHTVR